MNWLMLFKSPWFYLAVTVSFLGIMLKLAHWQIDHLKSELEVEKHKVELAREVNEKDAATINELAEQINKMVQEREAEQERIVQELAQRDSAIKDANNRAALEKEKRDELWKKTQSCQHLSELVVNDACVDVAQRLRERSLY